MNIYDLNTVDHYVKRMDEAERKHLGEAAWVSYNATISACFTIDLILFLFQLLFDVGILPTVVSSAIMLVALISITVADYRLTKAALIRKNQQSGGGTACFYVLLVTPASSEGTWRSPR